MRLFIVILMTALVESGCRTQNAAPESDVRRAPVTQAEVRPMAEAYIVSRRGACGTEISDVEDGIDFWTVQTVYGLGGRPGPDLRIDKLTRKITEVHH